MSTDAKAVDAGGRLRALVARALGDEHADVMVEQLANMVRLVILVLERNADVAPNHITIAYGADDGSWELTIRKHDGMTPAARVAALEAELDEARRREASLLRMLSRD